MTLIYDTTRAGGGYLPGRAGGGCPGRGGVLDLPKNTNSNKAIDLYLHIYSCYMYVSMHILLLKY